MFYYLVQRVLKNGFKGYYIDNPSPLFLQNWTFIFVHFRSFVEFWENSSFKKLSCDLRSAVTLI